MLVDNVNATKSGDEATRAFKPSGKRDAARAAAHRQVQDRLPRGAERRREESPPRTGTPALRESPENSVILVADVDMLADGAAVDVQDVFGRKVVVPSNGNLAFALGMVEQFAAGDDLISLRSRAAVVPPAHRGARARGRGAEGVLRQDPGARGGEAEDRRRGCRSCRRRSGGAAKGAQILSPEQQAELERFKKTYIETNLALKELRKNLRQDAEALVFWTKVANIALMPLLVALIGLLIASSRENGSRERAGRRDPGGAARRARRRRAALPAAGARAPAGERRHARPAAVQGPEGRRHRRDPHRRAEGHAHRCSARTSAGCIAERADFPADLSKVREFVLKAIGLKVGQSEPLGEKDRARLNLDASGTRVEFQRRRRQAAGRS